MNLRNVIKLWKNRYIATLWLSALLLVSACSTVSSTAPVSVSQSGSWVLLPIANLSLTATADRQAQTLIETELRARGVSSVHIYTPAQPASLRALLDNRRTLDKALSWARSAGYHYGVTGTINEWSYKSGSEQEPAVGMNLKLVDLQSGQVLWQANGARTGWMYKSLPIVADDVIRELLGELRLHSTTL